MFGSVGHFFMIFLVCEPYFCDILVYRGRFWTCLVSWGAAGDPGAQNQSEIAFQGIPFWSVLGSILDKDHVFLVLFFVCFYGCLFY